MNSSDPKAFHLQRPPPWGVRLQHRNLGGHRHFIHDSWRVAEPRLSPRLPAAIAQWPWGRPKWPPCQRGPNPQSRPYPGKHKTLLLLSRGPVSSNSHLAPILKDLSPPTPDIKSLDLAPQQKGTAGAQRLPSLGAESVLTLLFCQVALLDCQGAPTPPCRQRTGLPWSPHCDT